MEFENFIKQYFYVTLYKFWNLDSLWYSSLGDQISQKYFFEIEIFGGRREWMNEECRVLEKIE